MHHLHMVEHSQGTKFQPLILHRFLSCCGNVQTLAYYSFVNSYKPLSQYLNRLNYLEMPKMHIGWKLIPWEILIKLQPKKKKNLLPLHRIFRLNPSLYTKHESLLTIFSEDTLDQDDQSTPLCRGLSFVFQTRP